MTDKQDGLNVRERMVVTLTIFLIQMIHPWEYSHKYDKFWSDLKEAMKE